MDAATKGGLLELIWLDRRERDELDDRPPGPPSHGILADEVAEIVALFHEWAQVDRSHRKLAHRGSYLEWVWVPPSGGRAISTGVAPPHRASSGHEPDERSSWRGLR